MRKHRILIILFAAALALRVAYVLSFPLKTTVADAIQYDTIAWNLASGAGYAMQPGVPTPERAPGFPVFLGVLYILFGHSLLIATLAQAALGALTCLLLYALTRRLFGDRAALAAGWLACLYPVFIAYAGLLLSETLFTFFLVLFAYLFVRSEGGEQKNWLALSGVVLGLTTLIRPTPILFSAGIFLALYLSGAGRPLRKTALAVLAFSLVILPWTARNYAQFGVFLPVATGGSTCLYATGRMAEGATYKQGMDEVAEKWAQFKEDKEFSTGADPYISFDRQLKAEGSGKIKNNLSAYASVVLKRLPKYWLSSHSSVFGVDKPLGEYYASGEYLPIFIRAALLALHAGIFLLTLLGMYLARRSFKNWAVLLLMLLYFNMHAFFDLCPRYFVPIYPFMFIFCGVAAVRAWDKAGFASRVEKAAIS